VSGLIDISALSATPGMWRHMLMSEDFSKLPLSLVTLGGEIADQALLGQLARTFPQAQIRHIYASTEAGVGFVVSDGQAGFPATWLNNDRLPSQLLVDENQHLWIKSKLVSQAILNQYPDNNGFIDTQDLVKIDGDRVLFLGRASGTINVGGNKVTPERIEQIILQVEGVVGAYVYAKRSSVLGQLVQADVVACYIDNLPQLKKDILDYCKLKLQRYEMPVTLRFVDNLDITSAGKLKRENDHA
jgi:acyl-CoA synthetase (AMP-forming)/AMP-acid ligase II